MREPEAKHQLRARHQQLGRQALEEARDALLAHHAPHDPKPGLGVLEVLVLDARLDDVERRGHDERGRRAADGRDEVLCPRGAVVVAQLEEVFFGEGGAAEELYDRENVSVCVPKCRLPSPALFSRSL